MRLILFYTTFGVILYTRKHIFKYSKSNRFKFISFINSLHTLYDYNSLYIDIIFKSI